MDSSAAPPGDSVAFVLRDPQIRCCRELHLRGSMVSFPSDEGRERRPGRGWERSTSFRRFCPHALDRHCQGQSLSRCNFGITKEMQNKRTMLLGPSTSSFFKIAPTATHRCLFRGHRGIADKKLDKLRRTPSGYINRYSIHMGRLRCC